MSDVRDNGDNLKGRAEAAEDKDLAGGVGLMERIYDDCASRRLRADVDAKTYEKLWYEARCRAQCAEFQIQCISRLINHTSCSLRFNPYHA